MMRGKLYNIEISVQMNETIDMICYKGGKKVMDEE